MKILIVRVGAMGDVLHALPAGCCAASRAAGLGDRLGCDTALVSAAGGRRGTKAYGSAECIWRRRSSGRKHRRRLQRCARSSSSGVRCGVRAMIWRSICKGRCGRR